MWLRMTYHIQKYFRKFVEYGTKSLFWCKNLKYLQNFMLLCIFYDVLRYLHIWEDIGSLQTERNNEMEILITLIWSLHILYAYWNIKWCLKILYSYGSKKIFLISNRAMFSLLLLWAPKLCNSSSGSLFFSPRLSWNLSLVLLPRDNLSPVTLPAVSQ